MQSWKEKSYYKRKEAAGAKPAMARSEEQMAGFKQRECAMEEMMVEAFVQRVKHAMMTNGEHLPWNPFGEMVSFVERMKRERAAYRRREFLDAARELFPFADWEIDSERIWPWETREFVLRCSSDLIGRCFIGGPSGESVKEWRERIVCGMDEGLAAGADHPFYEAYRAHKANLEAQELEAFIQPVAESKKGGRL